MDLHGLVSGAIATINPFVSCSIQVSTGSTENAAGLPVPTYADAVVRQGQVQPLTFKDLTQLDGLNLNGTKRAIYIRGRVDGIIRVDNKGGDLVTIASGVNAGVWLVVQAAEAWPDWCRVLCVLQDGT